MKEIINLKTYMYSTIEDVILDFGKEYEIYGKKYTLYKKNSNNTFYIARDSDLVDCGHLCDRPRTLKDLYIRLGISWNYKKTIARGDILLHERDSEYYIVAMVDGGIINLISLLDGNRYTNGIKVEHCYDITYEEMCKLLGNSMGDFKYVGNCRDVLTMGDNNDEVID